MKNFFFEINTQFDNLGDALINRELITLLSSLGKVNIDTSKAPPHFKEWIEPLPTSITKIKNKLTFNIDVIRSLLTKNETWLVLNPGGVNGEISQSSYIKKTLKFNYFRILKLLGVKLIRIGISYEGLGARHLRAVRNLSYITDVHLVRDSISKQYCQTKSIATTGQMTDLAMNLDAKPIKLKEIETVLISLRKPKIQETHDLKPLIENIAKHKILKFGWQVKRDKEYQVHLQQKYSPTSEISDCTKSISETCDFYSNIDLIITNRLHVYLLALSSGTKSILLISPTGSKKIEGISKDLGLQNTIFNNPLEISEKIVTTDFSDMDTLFTKNIFNQRNYHKALIETQMAQRNK